MISESIANHPKAVVLTILLSLIISGYYASQMKIGVSTGRFELKNEPYKIYNKILNTFGGEKDNVIIVSISKDGYIFNKSDILSILELESKLNESIPNMFIQSIVDYLITGMHILKFQSNLSPQLNVSIDRGVFDDLSKLNDAIINYRYVNSTANETVRNSTYNIFALLPRSAGEELGNLSGASYNFSFTTILNKSKYNATHYNATNMLIDEIEIYQNLTKYMPNGSYYGGTPIVPENYSLDFVNKSIEDTKFNITYARIGMEDYNATFVEWFTYNVSFEMALTSMYSGYPNIALAIYQADKSGVENATQYYAYKYEKWLNYSQNLTLYLHGKISTDNMINSTEFMENISAGILRKYLSNYSQELKNYENETISWQEIARHTRYTQNVSGLQLNYTSYSENLDYQILPLLNNVISNLENGVNDYSTAVKLIEVASQNIRELESRIFLYYGEYVIYKKVLNILTNLKSVLMRNESNVIKQAAWNLIRVNFSSENFTLNLSAFYHALLGYRNTIFTEYEGNTTAIFWDYLSLEPFNMNYSISNVTFNTNYSYSDMIKDTQNYTQDDIDEGYREIKGYDPNTTERLVMNYTTRLSYLITDIHKIEGNLSFISQEYGILLGADAKNFTTLMNETVNDVKNYTLYLYDGLNASYSLRMIEDYFEERNTIFNTLLSRDKISTILIVEIDNSSYERKIYNETKAHSNNSVEYHTIATNVLVRQIEETAKHDMMTFIPIALILLVILLFITYGSLKHALLSLSAVLIVLTWLFAFAALIGWDFDPITLAVPIMLIGIGIDDGIYVTLRYMEERERRNKIKSTVITISSVGGALILTTLTSMAGFLSNTVSSMEDIQRFGFLAAIGLLFSFIVMNLYLPAANMIVDGVKRGRKKKEVEIESAKIGAKIALRNPYVMIIVALILSASGIVAMSHISTEFNIKDLAPQDSEVIQSYHYYENNFNASVELSYIYITGNLSSPNVLKAIYETQKNMENDETVVHQYPIVSPWSIMDKYAHAKRGEYYYNASFIKLFKESDTNHDGFPDRNIPKLYSMLEPEIGTVLKGDQAIIIVHTNSHDLKMVDQLYEELSNDAVPLRKYTTVKIAGDAIVGKASLDEINENQIRSLALSVLSAVIMLIILFRLTKRSYVLGIIASLPIIMVVTWNWLLMYFLGISLNVMTNTIASLCVGLGVDYGIHITHRFVEESSRFYSLRDSLFRATGRIGRGMIGASTTTIASIGILTFSSIPPLSNFALILSFSIFFAFIASLLILPSMLMLWAVYRRKYGYDDVQKAVKKAIENGDYKTLCRYHISQDYCLQYVLSLVNEGKIAKAREVIDNLKEEGLNLEDLLKSRGYDPRFE